MAERCSYADAIVIVSARSDRAAKAIADGIAEKLQETLGDKPTITETSGGWALLDYGDVVVHVFQEDTRAYYDIDRLWIEAPRVEVPAPAQEVAPSVPPPTRLAERRRRFVN